VAGWTILPPQALITMYGVDEVDGPQVGRPR
jgi:hypothetical protein